MTSPELSVVIPVYNEGSNIAPLCARIVGVLNRITPDWEIVFVDDGSADDTLDRIRAESEQDQRSGRCRSAATSARRSPSRPGSTMPVDRRS